MNAEIVCVNVVSSITVNTVKLRLSKTFVIYSVSPDDAAKNINKGGRILCGQAVFPIFILRL